MTTFVAIFENNKRSIRRNRIFKNDEEKIFQNGFGKNTGIGLFLSREILAINDLSITETGTEGTGARFEISVPAGKFRSRTTTP